MFGEVKMDQNGKSMGWKEIGLEMVWKWFGNGLEMKRQNDKNGENDDKRRQNQLHHSQFFDFSSYLVEIVIWIDMEIGGKWNGSTIVHRKLRES